MPQLSVWLDEREYQYLASYSHLMDAEALNDEKAPTTNPGEFMPPDVDRSIYEALGRAVTTWETQC